MQTKHHLVWTYAIWKQSILRHNPYACIKLSDELHANLHEEIEPFMELTPKTFRTFEKRLRRMPLRCHRDLLIAINRVSRAMFYGCHFPQCDRDSLKHNFLTAKKQMNWLDEHDPGWSYSKRRAVGWGCAKI